MAGFFIPPLPQRSADAERAYDALRDEAEACTGAVARSRRIELLECRRSGHDCLLQVGEPDVATGRTVSAIIQLGRSTYTVHYAGAPPGESIAPVVLQQSEVYSATDFQ
ncbi:MAG TPA: hypothetical protein VNV44_15090 [Solirubrobacteraceae bacterium]|jgi:hypothetical protein|nr:hypothetical protein [Solirubrobacteraceae bacterium]